MNNFSNLMAESGIVRGVCQAFAPSTQVGGGFDA
jgi:hypothetical protein